MKEGLLQVTARRQLDSQNSRDCRQEFIHKAQLCQRDQNCAILELTLQYTGHFDRQRRFANPPGAQDGQQPHRWILHEVEQAFHVSLSSNQRHQADWE
jgi:hypothetical protein